MSTPSTRPWDGLFFDGGGAVVNVRHSDHGAVGNGAPGDGAALLRARDKLEAGRGGVLYLPPGDYNCTDLAEPIAFTKSVIIVGAGNTSTGTPATMLRFGTGKGGLFFARSAEASVVRNLSLIGGGQGGGTDDGIRSLAHACLYENLLIEHFGRDGIYLDSSVVNGVAIGNCNGSALRNVRAAVNGRHGFNISGYDSNTSSLHECDATQNGGDGFYVEGGSNTLMDCHTAYNGQAAFRDKGNSNHYVGCYSEAGGPLVIDAGSTFGVWIQGGSFGETPVEWPYPAAKSTWTVLRRGSFYGRLRIADNDQDFNSAQDYQFEVGGSAGAHSLALINLFSLAVLFAYDPASGVWDWGALHQRMADARNWHFGTGTGTQLGTTPFQKIGFHGATPTGQGAAIPLADGTLAGNTTTINAIRAFLIAKGLTAA